MTLVINHHAGGARYRLVTCPACGMEFAKNGGEQRRAHLSKHDPEDFGLSPLGEIPEQ